MNTAIQIQGIVGSGFAGSVLTGSAIFTGSATFAGSATFRGFGASARGVKGSRDILIAASATNWATSAARLASIFST